MSDTKPWIRQHVGIVNEDKVHKALAYKAEFPHPSSIALYELTVAEGELKRIRGEVYGEQKGPTKDKEFAADCDPRVCAARERVARAKLDHDAHEKRLASADSLISIFQTESKNNRELGKLR